MLICFSLSCSTLRTERAPRIRPGEWPIAAGDYGRRNAAPTPLDPPLVAVWQYDASAGFAASPIIAEGVLLTATLKGEVHAVRLVDGEGTGSSGFGASVIGTPAVRGDTVYIPLSRSDQNLIAYRLSTGKTLWKRDLPDIESSLLLIGNRLYAGCANGTLYAVTAETGTPIWSYAIPREERTRMIRSSPAGDDSTIVFGCDNGKLYAIDADNGGLRWTAAAGGSIVAAPSIDSGLVFVGSLDSNLYARDLASGKIIWQQHCGSRLFGGQAVAFGNVYCGTAAGILYCFNERTGVMVWKVALGTLVNSAPLVAGAVLYVGCPDKHLSALDRFTGERIWTTVVGGRIRTSPVISFGKLFIAADDRKIYAFARDGGRAK
jgi:outer membrane protein assembly factor BamB